MHIHTYTYVHAHISTSRTHTHKHKRIKWWPHRDNWYTLWLINSLESHSDTRSPHTCIHTISHTQTPPHSTTLCKPDEMLIQRILIHISVVSGISVSRPMSSQLRNGISRSLCVRSWVWGLASLVYTCTTNIRAIPSRNVRHCGWIVCCLCVCVCAYS